MRRICCIALLALAMPLAAFGTNSVDFGNEGGMLSGSDMGLSLSGSELAVVYGLNGMGLVTGDLGSVSFSTGALLSGDLKHGGKFAGGGNFVISGDGSNGIPKGVIFSGTFDGPVTWTLVTLANGTHDYTLTGTITGKWYNGVTAYGATFQLTINTGKGYFNGRVRIASGGTNITTAVPEPGTLALFGSGLVGLAGMLHRKLKA